MNWTVPVALYGWIPLVAIVFAVLPPARAVLFSYLAGWMFLPVAGVELFGFFDYSKTTAVPLAVFLAVAAFDSQRLARFEPRLADLPIAMFCAVPMATSLHNGLGWYDALSGTAYQTISWGLPYLMGRLYFASPDGSRRLALGIFLAGLVYAPLCLWEIRMSPQLHATVYGFHQHEWVQTLRGGGYRPMVFMQHGLLLGLWMCAASIVGIALWMSGALRRMWGIPVGLAVAALIVTTVLCKSFGAIILLAVGALALALMRFARSSLPMALLVCMPSTYVAMRVAGTGLGTEMVAAVSQVNAERARSLAFRIDSEERLREKAEERALLGWGGWSRSAVRRYDDAARRAMVTVDSLWIIVFGRNGIVGLVSVLLIFLVPIVVLWQRCPPRRWDQPSFVWSWALALVLTLYAIDSMVNAMTNPIYLLIAGGLCGFAPEPARALVRARAARAAQQSIAGA